MYRICLKKTYPKFTKKQPSQIGLFVKRLPIENMSYRRPNTNPSVVVDDEIISLIKTNDHADDINFEVDDTMAEYVNSDYFVDNDEKDVVEIKESTEYTAEVEQNSNYIGMIFKLYISNMIVIFFFSHFTNETINALPNKKAYIIFDRCNIQTCPRWVFAL